MSQKGRYVPLCPALPHCPDQNSECSSGSHWQAVGVKGGREGGKEGGKEGRKGEFQAYTDCNDIYNTLNYLPLEDLVHECIDVASSEGLSQCSHLKDTAPQGPDV